MSDRNVEGGAAKTVAVAGEAGGEELEQTQAGADYWKEKYMRLAAELENRKKQLARQQAAQLAQFHERLMRDLLPLADNLQRALAHVSPQEADPGLYTGVELSLRAFLEVLAKYGVEPIDALGQPFDPELHEALGAAPHPTLPADTVMHVEQTGYTMNDRLLRPARVLVSTG